MGGELSPGGVSYPVARSNALRAERIAGRLALAQPIRPASGPVKDCPRLVRRYSTPGGWVGIGAGFWTNRGDSFGANYRAERGMPRDAFFAKGTVGQYVIIVPSERLVIVRLGRSSNWPPEADGVFQLVNDVVAATSGKAKFAGSD